MIETVDDRISEWVQKLLPGTAVTLDPPGDSQTGSGASLYLLELAEDPPPRGIRRPPLQLSLRYLVSTWAKETRESHRLLGILMFGAMEDPELEVDPQPVPATVWQALGTSPRPHFVLRVPLKQEVPEPEVKLVRRPLVVEGAAIAPLRGVLLGPDDIPLADAFLELPALQLFARTDGRGRFEFSGVPVKPRTKHIRVRVKGRQFPVTAEGPGPEPLVIRLDLNGR